MKLQIGNSTSRLTDMTQKEFSEVRNLLSYRLDPKKAYYAGFNASKNRYLIDKRGNFPSGLLPLVERYLQKTTSGHPLDLRTRPEANRRLYKLLFKENGVTPYPEQIDSVVECLKGSRGILQMPTGFGKSITMVLLVHTLGLKTLIVVPNRELKRQLRSTFDLLLKGSSSNVTIENVDSPALNRSGDHDCLIIDEAHHAAASTYRKLNSKAWNNIYYRYCFTATPWRSNEEEHLLMQSVTGEVLYSLSFKTCVEKGYVLPIEAYYVELPKKQYKGSTWQQVYSELVVNNEPRNEVISNLLLKLQSKETSSLFLVKEVMHGYNVLKKILRVINDDSVPFIYGENKNNDVLLRAFNKRKFSCLIGTTGVVGEGVDTKPAEYIIIAGLGKSKGAFMQACGRGVRVYEDKKSCKIIIFKDRSHKWTLSHFNEQVKILKEQYGVVPVKLDL